MALKNTSTHMLGPHRVYIDDDIVYLTFCGQLAMPWAGQFVELCEATVMRRGCALLLLDCRDAMAAGQDARRAVVDWLRDRADRLALAGFSADTTTRSFLSLMVRGAALLSRQPLTIDFFDNEMAARVCLIKKRRGLSERTGGASPGARPVTGELDPAQVAGAKAKGG